MYILGIKDFFQNQRVEQLLRALEKYCIGRGRQSWVADFCQCSPSTVCDWLHGRKQPTGEQALALHDLLYDGNSTQYWRPRKLRERLNPSRDVKKVTAMLEREFFGRNKFYMPKDKEEFISELIRWLEHQKKKPLSR